MHVVHIHTYRTKQKKSKIILKRNQILKTNKQNNLESPATCNIDLSLKYELWSWPPSLKTISWLQTSAQGRVCTEVAAHTSLSGRHLKASLSLSLGLPHTQCVHIPAPGDPFVSRSTEYGVDLRKMGRQRALSASLRSKQVIFSVYETPIYLGVQSAKDNLFRGRKCSLKSH